MYLKHLDLDAVEWLHLAQNREMQVGSCEQGSE